MVAKFSNPLKVETVEDLAKALTAESVEWVLTSNLEKAVLPQPSATLSKVEPPVNELLAFYAKDGDSEYLGTVQFVDEEQAKGAARVLKKFLGSTLEKISGAGIKL